MGARQVLQQWWGRRTVDPASCEISVQEKLGALITKESETSSGIRPAISLKTLKNYYLTDSMAKAAIDSIAEQVCGMGFYTVAEKVQGSQGMNAKAAIDEFADTVGLDEWAIEAARELAWAGFCMTKMITPKHLDGIEFVPPESIAAVYRDPDTAQPERWQQSLEGTRDIDPGDVIYIRNSRDSNEPFGVSLLRPLAAKRTITYTAASGIVLRTEEVPPAFVIKAQLELDMSKSLHRYGAPRTIYILPEANDEALQIEAGKIEQLTGDYVTNEKGFDVKTTAPTVSRGFDPFIDFLENRMFEGLQNPLLRLITSTGYTEASAREATRLAEYKIYSYQRLLKRSIERHIFSRVLTQNGIDPLQGKARLFWGPVEKPVLEPSTVLLAAGANPYKVTIIQPDEARKILVKLGWELSEVSTTPAPTQSSGEKEVNA